MKTFPGNAGRTWTIAVVLHLAKPVSNRYLAPLACGRTGITLAEHKTRSELSRCSAKRP